MEKFTLKVCTFADTEAQEVILDATGHYKDDLTDIHPKEEWR